MKKKTLQKKVEARFNATKDAIQVIVDCITAPGQRKKIKQDEQAKRLLDFYEIEI